MNISEYKSNNPLPSCFICKKVFKSYNALFGHVGAKHKVNSKKYWFEILKLDKYKCIENDCNKEVKGPNNRCYGCRNSILKIGFVKSGAWNKGLTKETDERVKIHGNKTSAGMILFYENGGKNWNDGLNKNTDDRLLKMSDDKKGSKNVMYGKTVKDFWAKSFGIEIAEKMWKEKVAKDWHRRTSKVEESVEKI